MLYLVRGFGRDYEFNNGMHFNTADNNDEMCCIHVPKNGFHYSFLKSVYFEVYDWESFAKSIGCEKISQIGIYQYEYDPYKMMYVGRNTIERYDYQQATGIVGITGYGFTRAAGESPRSLVVG